MFASRKNVIGVSAAFALAVVLAGCDGGPDLEINAPLLDAAGVNVKETLMGKPAPEPNLQERAPLVMPPAHAPLPVPGEAPQLASAQAWPTDPEEAKKQAKKDAEAKRKDYCRNGEWTDDKGNIDRFNKNVNQDIRCRPDWISRAMGTTKNEDEAENKGKKVQ
ncbi:hypothetical protein T281_03920 [Rhodomicrobium udaipurense JA643]|uniref:Lipoprotein n=1 Tax=Rhodomicrobium udaipurense TaxID=1202716 RepID=A0A8I1KI55_9HYPH|nr:hypothetical protein [Rhodomicrobium udaipurense]KAI95734.1 hypothetical protein T281_03920 [Rhodomicrobium udaipurense JA643]MBJ7542262.1 hypothetical protein [Rhodomicrobium udaipurense]